MTSRKRRTACAAAAVVLLVACSPKVAHLKNPAAPKCQASLSDAFAIMLVVQNEKPEVAEAVADAGAKALGGADLGPRPFKLSSPSGLQYALFFDDEMGRCLVHLVAVQRGAVQVADNVTYLDTRSLPGCKCEE